MECSPHSHRGDRRFKSGLAYARGSAPDRNARGKGQHRAPKGVRATSETREPPPGLPGGAGVRASPRGCSSMAVAAAFQAEDAGSIPVTRSTLIPGYGVGAVAALWTRSPWVRVPHPELCPGSPTGRGDAFKVRRLGVRIPRGAHAAVAHPVERRHGKAEAGSSSLPGGSNQAGHGGSPILRALVNLTSGCLNPRSITYIDHRPDGRSVRSFADVAQRVRARRCHRRGRGFESRRPLVLQTERE
jgi:hypothetical protein